MPESLDAVAGPMVGSGTCAQMVSYGMAFRTLISTAALAMHLDDPPFAIVDCRAKLDDPTWGAVQHAASHIPGAMYADLTHDLSGPKTGTNGRHPLPDPATLTKTLGRLGITSGMQVVAYDQENGMFASRLWWLLRWLGHDAVAVLDGGFKKWLAEGRPTESGEVHRGPQPFSGSPRAEMTVDVQTVTSRLGSGGPQLVDARAPERYRGDTEPIDKIGGHIPTAKNHFYQQNLDEQGLFRTPEELRAQITATVGDLPADQIVCYCGSGVTACHNLLAFEHAGLTGAKLYAGSWSEWSSDPTRPVERG
jgi:thiosulfate/3-mercaptopyruvate sulfurtransferase